jgi:glucose/arabinose dehydrogenase
MRGKSMPKKSNATELPIDPSDPGGEGLAGNCKTSIPSSILGVASRFAEATPDAILQPLRLRLYGALLAVVVLVIGCGCQTGAARPTPTKSASPSPILSPSAAPTPTPISPTTTSPANGSFKLTQVTAGLQSPVFATYAPGGSDRLFIVEQVGRIRVLKSGQLLAAPFLDIQSLVVSGAERGLLSVAFHPNFASNGVFIVNYTRASSNAADVGDTVIARYRVTPTGADVANPSTGQVLLTIDQPQPNHNGGLVMFGPDGMLFIGMGDGGGGGDVGAGHAPQGNGQNLTTLLGKMLRIQVGRTGPYTVPADNPSLGTNTRHEIWAFGLRNPWRFSFDRATGDMYVGDVGQNAWEEIDVQPAASTGGENYGWPVWEGSHAYRGGSLPGDIKPAAEYSHAGGNCSVTGGHVYRGTRVPSLQGFYFYGDYCSGKIWSLARVGGQWHATLILDTDFLISSFAEDEAGELYVVDLRGSIYRFDPT